MLTKSTVWGALLLGVGAWVAACGSSGTGESTSGPSGCTPGQQSECACPGGSKSVQVCNADGSGFGACDCGSGGSGGTGSNSSSSGNPGLCGNGKPDPGECDVGGEFYCPNDCMASSSSGTGGDCAGHVFYAGKVDKVLSVWATAPGAGGLTGLDAGNHACQVTGGDHVCDYEEVLKAEAQGELSSIPQGRTAWVHRTTVAMVNGAPSDPGPGGRCNDWTYSTNHISDGEYITFDTAGKPTYHLDNDTIFDGVNPHNQADLPCGGAAAVPGDPGGRDILCCFTKCN